MKKKVTSIFIFAAAATLSLGIGLGSGLSLNHSESKKYTGYKKVLITNKYKINVELVATVNEGHPHQNFFTNAKVGFMLKPGQSYTFLLNTKILPKAFPSPFIEFATFSKPTKNINNYNPEYHWSFLFYSGRDAFQNQELGWKSSIIFYMYPKKQLIDITLQNFN